MLDSCDFGGSLSLGTYYRVAFSAATIQGQLFAQVSETESHSSSFFPTDFGNYPFLSSSFVIVNRLISLMDLFFDSNEISCIN